jgi:TPR repeat protein
VSRSTIAVVVILACQLAGCVSVHKPPKPSVAALDQYLPGVVRGDVPSQNSYGRALMSGGQGVGRDPLLAQRYLVAAAEHGSASAQSYLAREYFGEIPAPLAKDAALGSYWATRAAIQGDSDAMRALSNYHGKADSSAFDPVESCKWLKVGYAAHAGGACDPKKLGAEAFAEAQRRAVEWRNQNPRVVEKP